jgi:hypothetical protein
VQEFGVKPAPSRVPVDQGVNLKNSDWWPMSALNVAKTSNARAPGDDGSQDNFPILEHNAAAAEKERHDK